MFLILLMTIFAFKSIVEMSFKGSFKYIALLLSVIAGAVSCNKDSDDSTSGYFDGTLSFSMPLFVQPGETYKLVPSGITNPDGDGVGYCWLVSDVMSVNDTTKKQSDGALVDSSFTFVAPVTLGDYTIKCIAFASGYYDSSVSKSITVVSSKSVTGNGISEGDPSMTDNREAAGSKYYYKQIGNLLWFRQNLSYSGMGIPYENAAAMTGLFGNYYTWEEAKTACPPGWRLPTDAEWVSLAKSIDGTQDFKAGETFYGVSGAIMADIYFNSTKMWEFWPDVKITNKSGFAALPAGYAIINDSGDQFYGVQEYAVYWTADEYDADQAVYRYMNVNKPDVLVGAADKNSFAASVRCVKDN